MPRIAYLAQRSLRENTSYQNPAGAITLNPGIARVVATINVRFSSHPAFPLRQTHELRFSHALI
jgi:hypothetical protein